MAAIWVVSDAKPGHLNQSLGLAEALIRARPDWAVELLPPLAYRDLLRLGLGRLSSRALPSAPPQFILCAGHATHLTTLLLARHSGAASVVMMRPSLPLRWFDYALLPRHDQPPRRAAVLQTEGALNRLQPGVKTPRSGTILLGGPSRHYHWQQPALLAKIAALVQGDPRQWVLSGSRRTPPATLEAIAQLNLSNLTLCPLAAQPAGWLVEQLAHSEQCWVSCDSVSMAYEALTAGCQTGLLALPPTRANNRLGRGIDWLRERGRIAWFDGDRPPRLPPAQPLAEADRAAAWLLQQLACSP